MMVPTALLARSTAMVWRPIRVVCAALVALIFSACVPELPGLPSLAQAPTAAPVIAPATLPTPSATPRPSPTTTPTPTITPTPSATAEPLPPTPTLAAVAAAKREAIFERVWTLVRDRYIYRDYRGLDWGAIRDEFAPRVATAEDPEAFYSLMHELIDRLGDEHSRFESPREVAEEQAEFRGDRRYAGIGAEVRPGPEGGLIVKLARGGPAEQAGLQPRDMILAVGGIPFTDTARFGPEGPISAVRGAPGSLVRLTVRSPGGDPHDVTLTRRAISSDSFVQVEGLLLPGTRVGLLRIDTFFHEQVDRRVRAELERLLEDGPLDGLIVDVRDNGGGRLDLLLDTIGLFADGGTIGSSRGRNTSNRLRVPRGETLSELAETPIVVLVGEETASAAEMFAAGMRALGRARVVGTASSGNVENLVSHDMEDGSRLWLAELTFQLPDGSVLEGSGVQPDRVVEAEWWKYEPGDDPQVQAALEDLGAISER
jgi:carboxyl-terminal processing protease